MRIVLCFLFALIASPVLAGWEKMAETDDVAYYIDPATTRKDGDLRRVWTVQDLQQQGKNGEMSRRALVEYDCKAERRRTLSYSLHSAPMSGGQLLLSNDYYSRWMAIPSDTEGEVSFKFVCAQ